MMQNYAYKLKKNDIIEFKIDGGTIVCKICEKPKLEHKVIKIELLVLVSNSFNYAAGIHLTTSTSSPGRLRRWIHDINQWTRKDYHPSYKVYI